MSDEPLADERLVACLECSTPHDAFREECRVDGCHGEVVIVDHDHGDPLSEVTMDLLRDLAAHLHDARVGKELPDGLKKAIQPVLTGETVEIRKADAEQIIDYLRETVHIPPKGDRVRWWVDVEREAREKLESRRPTPPERGGAR